MIPAKTYVLIDKINGVHPVRPDRQMNLVKYCIANNHKMNIKYSGSDKEQWEFSVEVLFNTEDQYNEFMKNIDTILKEL